MYPRRCIPVHCWLGTSRSPLSLPPPLSRRLHDKPYWKPELWGVPVNQEDMMATLLAFSYNVLVGSEMVLGRPLSDEVCVRARVCRRVCIKVGAK